MLISVRNITHCHWRPGEQESIPLGGLSRLKYYLMRLGPTLKLLEYSQLAVGFALSLLGLLNIGKSTVDFSDNVDGNFSRVSPIYVLISYDWLIPTVAIVYFLLLIAHKVRHSRVQVAMRRCLLISCPGSQVILALHNRRVQRRAG